MINRKNPLPYLAGDFLLNKVLSKNKYIRIGT
jgi:hypothetical protein